MIQHESEKKLLGDVIPFSEIGVNFEKNSSLGEGLAKDLLVSFILVNEFLNLVYLDYIFSV